MAEPVGQAQLAKWWAEGKEMLAGFDVEIDQLVLRVRELRAMRARVQKVFGPVPRERRLGRPRKEVS